MIGSMGVTLPDNQATDGHSTAQFGFSGFDPAEGVRIACDYDSFAVPDDSGDPLGGTVTVGFGNGASLSGVLSATSASVAGQSYTRTVLTPGYAQPTITTQLWNQTNVIGNNVTFTVSGSAGLPPFGYQWFFNGSAIGGATNSFLNLTNVMPSAQGNYQVVITNASGSVTSIVAVLTVLDVVPPSITARAILRSRPRVRPARW